MTRGQRSALLWAQVALSLGGWGLHARIHPLTEDPLMLLPFVLGLVDVLVVTGLFLSRRTAGLAYLLNGLFVIYGITIMTQFGLAHGADQGAFRAATNMAADCFILFGDFLVGKALFDGYWGEARSRMKPWRYLAPVWWLVHFLLIPLVYTLGNTLWR